MKKIYKYPLLATHKQTIEIPANSQLLSIQNQNDTPVLWVLFDEENEYTLERLAITLICTGEPSELLPTQIYLGSVQMFDGRYVLHAFV